MTHSLHYSTIQDTDIQRDLFSSNNVAREHLVTALLSIFVDIEHTGESMEFEDKFSKDKNLSMVCIIIIVEFISCSLPATHI